MTGKLRSNFTPGSTPWAMRRAQWSALGLTDEDLEKPKIAIVNSSSQLASCFSHLDEIVAPLKAAIEAAGGVAFEVRTAAPSDAITSAGAAGQYILPSRDLIASDIEVAVEGALLDGMVCLASCDKTTPGQLMAAGRLNIPTIIVGCGYQPSGSYKGESVDFEDIFRFAGHVNAGRMTVDELAEMSRCAVTGPGVCAGMGTANSMHLAAEALGMALPGTTPVLARGQQMWAAVARAGRRIVELVNEDIRPRSLLTAAAFSNAVTAILAVSGSVNCLKHLQAIAVEAGCDADVYRMFEELAPKVPLLTDVKPNGDTQITQFDAAGGTLGLLKQLAPLLDLSARTVGGTTLGEAVAAAPVDQAVIRPLDAPLATHPAIVVMRGSLAPDGRGAEADGRRRRAAGVPRAGQGGPLPGRGRRRRQGGPVHGRRRGRPHRAGAARLPRHGADLGADVRHRRRGPVHQGRGDHRRPDVRAGQRRPSGRRGIAGRRGGRPAGARPGRRHDQHRRTHAGDQPGGRPRRARPPPGRAPAAGGAVRVRLALGLRPDRHPARPRRDARRGSHSAGKG